MGIVYRASDPTIGREVALKVLSLSASREEGTNSPQEMFMREVRAAGRLAHPSIVTIHDAFDDPENETSCIVMELVPGVTLEKILDSGSPLTTEQIFSIIRQVVEGLDYAHRNQVIHRDLKPANILVTDDGHAKITDFGIAKVLAREGVARTVGILGTPSYMSPEQVRGDEIDARTDIFSLGIIIFTLFSGKKPFSGNTAAVMFRIVYEDPPAPSSLNPQFTPAHDYVVKKCLAKDRNLRYSSARDLLGDLDDLQHGRPLRSRAVAPAPAAAPPARAEAPPLDRMRAMAIPGHVKAASQQASPWPAPSTPPSARPQQVAAQPPKPTPPPAPVQPPKPVIPPPFMPTPAPAGPPHTRQTLPMGVPDLSAASSSVPPSQPAAPMPSVFEEPTLMERTLPMQVPDLSAVSPQAPSSPRAVPVPPAPPDFPLMEKTLPMQAPDVSAASEAAEPQPAIIEPLPEPVAAYEVETAGTSGAVLPAPKSKIIALMFGGVAVVLLAAATWGYWKFHQRRAVPSPPPQVAVQTPPATPPPIATPTPSPAAAAERPTPPVSAAPKVAKKTAVHKPKQATVPHPSAPAPAPPPGQPEPATTTASPKPSPSTPSPEDIAKAEAAKLANIPRVVQVLCNYSLKEATFTFSSGGQTLFSETLKAKKKKGGFLGIKGSYEGTSTHTITVPAGASEVSIHVVAKDGATDLSKAIKMPPRGGFVPTLAVEVDSDHLSLNWKGSSAAK